MLHGAIECTYYDSLQESPEPNPLYPNPTVLTKGDVTWLGNNIYQIHRLRNLSTEGKVCCTVQCYQYGDSDTVHYEAFRFLKAKEEVENFIPDRLVFSIYMAPLFNRYSKFLFRSSDADFATFKNTIRQEWNAVLSGKPPASIVEAAIASEMARGQSGFMTTNLATNSRSAAKDIAKASTVEDLLSMFMS